MTSISDAQFHEGMAAVYERRERDAAALEVRRARLTRKLTPDEDRKMEIYLSDSILVESLRTRAWATLGSTLPTPRSGWPDNLSATDWYRIVMLSKSEEDRRAWNEPWRVRARAQDREDMALRDRLKEVEQREQRLAAREARDAELAKPPTPEESEALETARVIEHFRALAGTDDPSTLDEAAFTKALASIPKSGFVDGRTMAEHLRDMRTATAEPEPAPQVDDGKPTGLHRLLGQAAR